MSVEEAAHHKLATAIPAAFWLRPDWSGGNNLRDPGTRPFWMLPPLMERPSTQRDGAMLYGVHHVQSNTIWQEPFTKAADAQATHCEFGTVPGRECYAITVAEFDRWATDLGVTKASDSTTMTRVVSNPMAGQYSASQGIYVFSPNDANVGVYINYLACSPTPRGSRCPSPSTSPKPAACASSRMI